MFSRRRCCLGLYRHSSLRSSRRRCSPNSSRHSSPLLVTQILTPFVASNHESSLMLSLLVTLAAGRSDSQTPFMCHAAPRSDSQTARRFGSHVVTAVSVCIATRRLCPDSSRHSSSLRF
eukprot:scaffold119285_cov31-Attheya_sp.AAC.1